ncbi:hypothetical protein BCR35DRAFT_30324 [Leucosporidium creatinivorum]|uniref:MYND-type domain-containing protein n=1 Tax=Leucosporidium creatinivorum TaxID=106004 RepID=A0A1Y2FVL9_9BASI|nr:hypothetical protein BCR35DRAFT_30324 [Leucosporidium creatinivorum]
MFELSWESWQEEAAGLPESVEDLMLVATAAPPRGQQALGAAAFHVRLKDREGPSSDEDWLPHMKERYVLVRDRLAENRGLFLHHTRTTRKDACDGCGKTCPPHKLRLCSRCRDVKSCSSTCQKSKYADHRLFRFLKMSQHDSITTTPSIVYQRLRYFIEAIAHETCTCTAYASATSLYTSSPDGKGYPGC